MKNIDQEFNEYFDVFNSDKIANNLYKKNLEHSKKIIDKYDLNNVDKSVCWVSGTIAGVTDLLLIAAPKSGGYINENVNNKISNLFTKDQVKVLERENWVPYDAATSRNLGTNVSGLNPRTHRFQSLGHDPILGFFFGVRDIMKGEFTAFDNSGNFIRQFVSNETRGMNLFEAIARQLGHLKSDIATPAGLPIPFMSLLQKLQFGDINGKTIGEVSRLMYAKGYNFNHLLTMSVPALIIEVSVRIFYMISCLANGSSIMESLPINKPKLDKMLFNAYLIATAFNAGKIIGQQGNLFAINPVLWAGTLRYGFSVFKTWKNNEKEVERHRYVMDIYKEQSDIINGELDKLLEYHNLLTVNNQKLLQN